MIISSINVKKTWLAPTKTLSSHVLAFLQTLSSHVLVILSAMARRPVECYAIHGAFDTRHVLCRRLSYTYAWKVYNASLYFL